jgi:small subunit ribosomal protein S16
MERINYWLSVGATPSDRVATLLKKIKNNDFGAPLPAPERLKPKDLPVAEAPAEGEAAAPAEEGAEAAS